jgi:hypothetical protein
MLKHQRSHVLSAYATVIQHLAEIRKVAATGETPGGSRTAPLPNPPRDQVIKIVEAIGASLTETLQALAPDQDARSADSKDSAGSRMWAIILFRTVEELLKDLNPEIMERRYGTLDPREAAILRNMVSELLNEINQGINLLS